MKKTPLISVVMPVKNGQLYLHESINSILQQSITDFELIILNDHSSDKTHDIIKTFVEVDKRVKYIKDSASGLVNNLNYGVNISRGKYIARMDSDDISTPLRFEKQIQLISKEDCDLCGTAIEIIDEKGSYIKKVSYPTDNQSIRQMMIYKTCLAHPTVLAKANILKKHSYDKKYQYVEDLELWLRLIRMGVKMSNHTEYLLKYRTHGFNISHRKSIEQQRRKILLRRDYFNMFGLSDKETQVLYDIEMGKRSYNHEMHDPLLERISNEYNTKYISYIKRSKPFYFIKYARYLKYKFC